jgi:hypothetical protein
MSELLQDVLMFIFAILVICVIIGTICLLMLV